jgi:aminoglycoside phosphotransferase (APT) family kinase protein
MARHLAEHAAASSVDLGTLNELLAPAYPGQRAVAGELVSGGLANTSYKVRLSKADTTVVIRIYVRDRSAAHREASILHLLNERVPVPEVIYASPEGHEPNPYLILRWIDGVPLDQIVAQGASSDARRAVRAAGAALANVQEFRFARSGFFGNTLDIRVPFPSEPSVVVCLMDQFLFDDRGEERLGAALAQRVWRFVKNREEMLSVVERDAMLVHGDFNGPNVIVRTTPDGPHVAALIDWEYAHSGTPLVDLGSILRDSDSDRAPWFEEELIRGYRQEGGILPPNWRQVSRIVDLVKLCAFVRSPNAGDVAVEAVRSIIETELAGELP